MNKPDQYLYINWEDEHRNLYRIGILARIDDVYYLKTFGKKTDAERDAYSHGYVGLPGFVQGEIYKSTNKLFDFFALIYILPPAIILFGEIRQNLPSDLLK